MTTEETLLNCIENILLDFAELKEDLTTSDFQGVATAKAKKIIEIVRGVEL